MSDASTPFLEYASKPILMFCGSLVAISIAFKVVGIDFEPIIDAYSAQIIANIDSVAQCTPSMDVDGILNRLTVLETNTHKPGVL